MRRVRLDRAHGGHYFGVLRGFAAGRTRLPDKNGSRLESHVAEAVRYVTLVSVLLARLPGFPINRVKPFWPGSIRLLGLGTTGSGPTASVAEVIEEAHVDEAHILAALERFAAERTDRLRRIPELTEGVWSASADAAGLSRGLYRHS